MTLAGWSDAAYGGQSTEGICRLGYTIGLMSSTLKGACRILPRTSKFTRKMVKSSLGGEIYALSEMVDHMLLLKDFGTFSFNYTTQRVWNLLKPEQTSASLQSRSFFGRRGHPRRQNPGERLKIVCLWERGYFLVGGAPPARLS